jgi:hypothetical protein
VTLPKISHPLKRAFLAAYRQTGNIRASTEAAKVDRRTYYDWCENDLVFAAAAQVAKEEYGDILEAKLSQMAVKHDNVTALIVALKMAGRFRERTEQTIEQAGRMRIEVVYGVDPRSAGVYEIPALGSAADQESSATI